MMDIIELPTGEDLRLYDSEVGKAGNVLSVQLGSLSYSPDFGVDLKFFLESEFHFQNDSFKAYLVQRLAENQVNVAQVISTLETLYQKYTFLVGSAAEQNRGLIL